MNTLSAKKYKGFIPEPKVINYLYGRVLDIEQTPFSIELLETYVKYGYAHFSPGIDVSTALTKSEKPAILFDPNVHIKCNRCFNIAQQYFVKFECKKCRKTCAYCRKCLNMGRVSICTNLIRLNKLATHTSRVLKFGAVRVIKANHQFKWNGTLTNIQQQASNELLTSLLANKEHIIHAVCGAGKTELLFNPIFTLLKQGKRVCVATPRTDVVLELYPRFQQAFPHSKVQALYGSAPLELDFSQLVLSTTHQLYRFEQAFDAIIVDEADAFPYIYDETLRQAVEKARKPQSAIAYVTATPSTILKQKIKENTVGYSTIAKRFHNYPLPVPRKSLLWFYELQIKRGYLPKKLQRWLLTQLEQKKPYLIFFPTIELMEIALPLIQNIDSKAISVHAQDKERKEKVMQLRREQVNGLLTTTILERGVTIKNVQVAVVGAEQEIFNANALIQIAGRVGRNIQYPNGDVVFFHHGVTKEIDRAIKIIKHHNKEAFGGG